jgi:L-iditol 2-dehydrogenase
MKEALMTGAGVIDFREVEVPAIGNHDVLIRVHRIGVCGSDIHVYHGKHKYMTFPIVQGHEGAGTVEALGANVTGLKVGDRVTILPVIYCGTCRCCRDGRYNACETVKVIGVHSTGMASELYRIDASKVIKLPDDMDFDTGAMVEPTAVAVHAVRRNGSVENAKVLVLGAGPIGNLVAQVAKNLGAALTMITDINPMRLKIAEDCGIDFPVNPSQTDLKEAVFTNFGPDGADVIFDCAAVRATLDQATSIARKGTNIVIVGNFTEPVTIELGLMQRREINFITVMLYNPEDYVTAVDLLSTGKIQTAELITNYFSFDQYLNAYQFIDAHSREVMKVMIKVAD